MVDGLAGRRLAAVEVDRHRLAELLVGLLGGHRRRHRGDVGAGDRHRPGLGQQLQGHRVQRHPERHRAPGVAEVPGQRRRVLHHQGQRAGPERLDQVARRAGHRADQAVDGVPGTDQHRHRHVPAAALGGQQAGHRGGVEGVRADAVQGVGRQHHERAGAHRARRGGDRHRAGGGIGAVQQVTHGRPSCRTSLGPVQAPRRADGCGSAADRRAEPRPAGQVRLAGHLVPAPGGRQQPVHRRGLVLACSIASNPPGRSSRPASPISARHQGQPVRAGEQRLVRVVRHLGRQRSRIVSAT